MAQRFGQHVKKAIKGQTLWAGAGRHYFTEEEIMSNQMQEADGSIKKTFTKGTVITTTTSLGWAAGFTGGAVFGAALGSLIIS